MTNTIELTKTLMAKASITPSDRGCHKIIAERLQALGFEISHFDHDKVSNLYATKGECRPHLLFLGHTDVVPPGPLDEWHAPPFEPTVHNEILYGRGAVDMKSSVAAMITAIERFYEQQSDAKGQVSVLLTSDEEGDATHGTVHALQQLELQPGHFDYTIVGEPTSEAQLGDTVKVGRRGSLTGYLTVRGEQGHVAYPADAHNPIDDATRIMSALQQQNFDEGDEYFDPTHCEIVSIKAGTNATNVIPSHTDLVFNFRYAPASSVDYLESTVRAQIECVTTNYELSFVHSAKPFFYSPGALAKSAQKVLETQFGLNPTLSTVGGTSDGRFLRDYTNELIELGPRHESAHKINECIPLDDINQLSSVYEALLNELLN